MPPTQPHLPERQCACPCGPFHAELKASIALMTFKRHPVPALVPSSYPSDSLTGEHIPVGQLVEYSKTHIWPDDIYCFCSLRPDGKARSVRIFSPSQGRMQGSPCLRCSEWTPDGVSGCRYFVNLQELFDGGKSLFGTELVPLQSYPLRDERPRPRMLLTSSGACPSPSTASLPAPAPSSSGPSGPSLTKPRAPGVEGNFPLVLGVKPGAITDWERICAPPAVQDVLNRVESMPLPAATEVAEVFDEMVNGSGVPYRRFMSVIGGCIVCDQIMALSNIGTHTCIGRTKETGPCPSKHPLLAANRRTLPAAGSVIKERDAGQGASKVDDDDDDDVEFIEKIGRKRKVKFEAQAPQRVLVSAIKKPRITNTDGPSQVTPTSGQPAKTEAEMVDLTSSPVRIPTPQGSRDVYRDWNEEFIMYRKV